MKRTATRLGFVATVTLAALLTGCADDGAPSTLPKTAAAPITTAASPPPASSAVPETPEQAKQHAIDAYLGFQKAFETAGAAGDPDYAGLAKYGTGAALKLYTNGLESAKAQGLRGRGQTIFRPKIASLSPPATPTKASVQDCMDTSKTERYKVDGSPFKDPPGGQRLALADVERISDEWKVTAIGIREVGSCKL